MPYHLPFINQNSPDLPESIKRVLFIVLDVDISERIVNDFAELYAEKCEKTDKIDADMWMWFFLKKEFGHSVYMFAYVLHCFSWINEFIYVKRMKNIKNKMSFSDTKVCKILKSFNAQESFINETADVYDEIASLQDRHELKQWERNMYCNEIPKFLWDKLTGAIRKFLKLA